MSAGIKSRPGIVRGTRHQSLTDKPRRRKRPGTFVPALTAFFAGLRFKPTALSHGSARRSGGLARGRPSSSSTTVTISTHATRAGQTTSPAHANPQRIFFSLNRTVLVREGGATAPPISGRHARYRADREALSKRRSGVGARTPTPASHHVGVIGGGLDHHLTPTRCEAAREVVSDV